MDKLVEIDAQLLTSVAFLAVTFAAGECIRYLMKKTYPDEEDLTRMYVMEIEMQFERIVTAFETVFVLQAYGLFAYYVLFMLTNLWFSYRWEPKKSNMSGHALSLVDGTEEPFQVVALTSVELVTSFLVYPLYVKQFWLYFQNQPFRGKRVHGTCPSDMQAGLVYTSLAEGVACLFLQVLGLALASLLKDNALLQNLISLNVVYVLVIACLHISGSYFNPILASAVQAGCEGVVVYEHILCYWVAPIVGAVLGAILFRRLFGNSEQKTD